MMKKILVVNAKGGCGKSTIATNLASYYALWKVPVALVDYDPHHSSLDWLAQRSAEYAAEATPIHGVDASKPKTALNLPSNVQRVILDSPARIDAAQMRQLFDFADTALMPVLPSPMDIRATGHFIGELMLEDMLRQAKLGLVANRVRANTLVYSNLERFLKTVKIPLVTRLRDSQNYIRAAEQGYGIFEMPRHQVDDDVEQWRPLIRWLEKK